MMTRSFIDSNILVYHFAGNHPRYSPRSSALIGRLDRGEETGVCTSTVIMETAFVLERTMRVPRRLIAKELIELVSLPAIEFDFRETLLHAVSYWEANGPLSLPDAYHLAFTQHEGIDRIYTFDRKLNRFPGIERIEP